MTDKEIFQDLQYLWSIGFANGILEKLLGESTPEKLREHIEYWLEVGPDIGGDNSWENAQRALEILMLIGDRVKEIAEKYGVKK